MFFFFLCFIFYLGYPVTLVHAFDNTAITGVVLEMTSLRAEKKNTVRFISLLFGTVAHSRSVRVLHIIKVYTLVCRYRLPLDTSHTAVGIVVSPDTMPLRRVCRFNG